MKLGYMPDGTGAGYPFEELFTETVNVMDHGFDDIAALLLWGGEDISTIYYDEPPHIQTQNKGLPSPRDVHEWTAMKYAYHNRIPIIGVCRGAQFLCVFAGGKLIQHVVGHHGDHAVNTEDGRSMITSSCHHQMMYPFDVNHEMLAWSSKNLSNIYEDGEGNEIPKMKARVEPEVVYFPKVRGLAIQGHPEWMKSNSEFVKYCRELVTQYLLIDETI